MKRIAIPALACAAALAGIVPALAEPPSGRWAAADRATEAVTGDVTFSPTMIRFQNGKTLPLAVAYTVHGTMVYEVTSPSNPVLLNGNRICREVGNAPIRSVAVVDQGFGIHSIQFYTDAGGPHIKPKGMSDACAEHSYETSRR